MRVKVKYSGGSGAACRVTDENGNLIHGIRSLHVDIDIHNVPVLVLRIIDFSFEYDGESIAQSVNPLELVNEDRDRDDIVNYDIDNGTITIREF